MCGPLDTPSLGGNKYFLTFVDDFLRKICVYLIKEKAEVFSVFEKCCAHVERQSDNNLKILRVDGGGEYKSREFNKFCEENGIVHEVTAPYTPQHNELAERINKMLVDMTRCMLKGKCMSYGYWGEEVTIDAYIFNRCPTKRLNFVTPEEA